MNKRVTKRVTKKEDHPAANRAGMPLPSRSTLAMMAAIAFHGAKKRPADAVSYALQLWIEADRALEIEASANEWRGFEGIPLPRKFRASLGEFLRLIVRAKTPADSTKRLRDFCQSEIRRGYGKAELLDKPYVEQFVVMEAGKPTLKEREVEAHDTEEIEWWAANQIGGWKKDGFRDKRQWLHLAKRYLDWWARQKSAKARAAAKKPLDESKPAKR